MDANDFPAPQFSEVQRSTSPNSKYNISDNIRRHTTFNRNKKQIEYKDKNLKSKINDNGTNYRKQEFFEKFIKKNLEKNKTLKNKGIDVYRRNVQPKRTD
jgi:hypothetical protein